MYQNILYLQLYIYIYVSVIVLMKPDCQTRQKQFRGLHRLDPLSVSCRHCNAKVQGPDSTAFGQRLGRIHWSKKVSMLIYVFCNHAYIIYNVFHTIRVMMIYKLLTLE